MFLSEKYRAAQRPHEYHFLTASAPVFLSDLQIFKAGEVFSGMQMVMWKGITPRDTDPHLPGSQMYEYEISKKLLFFCFSFTFLYFQG